MIFKNIHNRAQQLNWEYIAVLVLASAERLLSYRQAYLKLDSAQNELDTSTEPDLVMVLDRGWAAVIGADLPQRIAFGFDGDLDSFWGALAGVQIKAHLFDVVDGVVERMSIGYLMTLMRSGFEIFCSLQEFADDGFVAGPIGWSGPEAEELRAMTSDLEWLERKDDTEGLLELRNRWKNIVSGLVLKEI